MKENIIYFPISDPISFERISPINMRLPNNFADLNVF